MTVALKEDDVGKTLTVTLSGKLTKEDYQQLGPEIDRLIAQHGKIRIAAVMHDFHGWTIGALWDDIKFDFKHFAHIERLALIGESKWEKGMSVFCKPFTTAKVQYFDISKADEALVWVRQR